METDAYSLRGIRNAFITGFCIIAAACVFQALFAPTVRINCPARTASAPDCDLRWLAAFDLIPVRHAALPGLESVPEIVQTAPTKKGGTTTLYLNTAAGPVRTIMWGGEPEELQAIRDPLREYLANPQAPPLELTLWPARVAIIRYVANAIVCFGLLFWIWLPVQMFNVFTRQVRA